MIGASEAVTGHLEQVRMHWARPGMLWVGLALIVPAALFVILRHKRNLPHVSASARRVLNTCRIGVLLLMLVVLAGPYVRVESRVETRPIVAVVLDDSLSMTLPAGPFAADRAAAVASAAGFDTAEPPASNEEQAPGTWRRQLDRMSRLDLARAILAHQHPKLSAAFDERFDVRTYRVARTVRRAPSMHFERDAPEDDDGAESNGTALGTLLNEILDESAGAKLAGIILLTDGRNTLGPEPLRVLQQRSAATTSSGTPAPVWAVPIGSAVPLQDVTILDAFAPTRTSVNDVVSVVATISSHGFEGRSVNVSLEHGGKTIQEKPLTLRDGSTQQVELQFKAEEAGTQLLKVQVQTQPEETVPQNNSRTLQIDADTHKIRLLYIEGFPRWDFRFLDHALRRDQGLDVTIIMEDRTDTGDDKIGTALPRDAESFAQFDAILLGDVSAQLLPRRQEEALVEAVETKGTGLIVQAGPLHMPHALGDGPLNRILPVRLERNTEGALLSGREAPAHLPFAMGVTAQGAVHPAMRLYDSATRSRAIWGQMPRFYWSAATAEKPRPAATVLADVQIPGGRRPLIVEQFAGRGRAMFVGTDSTFRWRQNIGSHIFYRFWGQAIRHVARQPDRGAQASWIELKPIRAEPGETVMLELFAVDGDGQPLEDESVEIQLSGEDFIDTLLLRRQMQAGHFRGNWQSVEPGDFQFSFTDASGGAVRAAVSVAPSGQENRRADVDRAALAALAAESGGAMVEPDALGNLPDLLEGEPTTERRVHEEEVWDNWLTLILLVALYCTDVGVRRLLGLT